MRNLATFVIVLGLLSLTLLRAQRSDGTLSGTVTNSNNAVGPRGVSSASSVTTVEDKPLVFYLNGTKVQRIAPLVSLVSTSIPSQLVMPPGTYSFMGRGYNLEKEGLYRFVLPNKTNLQRIVYTTDIDSFLSAISWIRSHGNRDNSDSTEQLTEKALHSKLLITCSVVSAWAKYLLTSRDIKSRLVSGLTLGKWNSYDDGHSLIEVWRNKWNKWVLYDLDNSSYFISKQNGIPMSLIEFAKAVPDNNYKIIHISLSTFDVGGFKSPAGYDYAFIMEPQTADIRRWYKRVMQVPLIYDDTEKTYVFYDNLHRNRVESYNTDFKFLSRKEFDKKFYPKVRPR